MPVGADRPSNLVLDVILKCNDNCGAGYVRFKFRHTEKIAFYNLLSSALAIRTKLITRNAEPLVNEVNKSGFSPKNIMPKPLL